MPLILSPSHHGTEFLLDAAGEPIARVYRDPIAREWCVTACADRYPTRAALPPVFEGRFAHSFAQRGDFLRFFDLPWPGVRSSDPSEQSEAA